jgi:hypothetical protein
VLRAPQRGSAPEPELLRQLDTVKLAARSLGARVLDAQASSGKAPLSALPLDEQLAIVTLNGALTPSSSWYVLEEVHIDAIDVAYEDDYRRLQGRLPRYQRPRRPLLRRLPSARRGFAQVPCPAKPSEADPAGSVHASKSDGGATSDGRE